MVKILFACGGSIGHIAPCLAVWRAVESIDPKAQAHFVCSTRPEDGTFLRAEKMEWTALGARNISVWSLPVMTIRAWKLLKTLRPGVIFSKGGGVTIPVALAGWIRGIPIVVHESDSVSGRATTFISRFAKAVCHGFPDKIENGKLKMENKEKGIYHLPFTIFHYTGNPLRPNITSGSREKGLKLTNFSGDRPILLVTGGSQGAIALNDAVTKHLTELLAIVDIIHITGEGKGGATMNDPRYWTRPFVHGELADLYAASDLALSRAGAGSLSELAGNGVPAILVPLEGVAHDHQLRNAETAHASGGCVILRQLALDDALVTTVRHIASDSSLRKTMSEKIRKMHMPDSALRLAKMILAVRAEHCGVS